MIIRRRARVGAALAAVVTLALTAGCASHSAGPQAAAATATACPLIARSALVPTDGTLFGVNLDWGSETLAVYAGQLGHHPAAAVWFTDFPLTDDSRKNLLLAAEQVRGQGGILVLTLQPSGGLVAVTDAAATDLANALAKINSAGTPVIVRFAHEMNGSWYAWGEQPTEYVAAFRRVAAAVHSTAPGSAMLWAPNYGGGYPFSGGQYEAKKGTADFTALDTDHNGKLNGKDDPYAPYWPGDDAVDWVGMSLYHWGNKYPWGANVVPEPGKFAAELTGTYNGANGDDRAVPDFYATYAERRDKPLAIVETAALVNTSRDTSKALAIKKAWWSELFAADIPQRFPKLKMINWFEWDKDESEVHARVDWTATQDPATRAAFTAGLPQWLRYGSGKTGCYRPAP